MNILFVMLGASVGGPLRYAIDQYFHKFTSKPVGIFLVNTFSIIYMNAGIKSSKGQLVFWIMFLVWNIYGIAFLLPTAIKNTTFNIVDLFSKNFFELYISMLVFTKRI